MSQKLPSFYMITGRKAAKNKSLYQSVKLALKNGVKLVQLREKDLSTEKLIPLAKKLKTLCRAHHAKLLINSRVDIALALNLDGVHLPAKESCLSLKEARLLLGPKKLIGKSTHSLKEALEAQKEKADFITFGPVFPTPSKKGLIQTKGLNQLARVSKKVRIPVYALGGLTLNQLQPVRENGAHGIAGIRAFIR